MKRLYVRVMRGLRRAARATGVLGLLERRAPSSRNALWGRSLFAIYDFEDMVALDVPWWTFSAIDHVEGFLRAHPAARAFEWGAGASTLWLSRRCREVVAIEHDPAWYSRLTSALPGNVDLRHVAAVPVTGEPITPSRKRGFEGLDFSAYVDAIDHVAGDFDVIVIDGRAREACFRKALGRLAPGGIIVFDNVGRHRYRAAIEEAGTAIDVSWTRGRTVALPYPDRTAIVSRAI